jgi:hypothetical protein
MRHSYAIVGSAKVASASVSQVMITLELFFSLLGSTQSLHNEVIKDLVFSMGLNDEARNWVEY